MALLFVHLSDIHFGQERGRELVHVHRDVRDRVVEDVTKFAKSIAPRKISGIAVTGDIAFAGKPEEYEEAGEWLDQLTHAIGARRSDVQLVPGNHDIDRDEISAGGEFLLREIDEHGEKKLNELLSNENDRDLLYRRFGAYADFADAYNCPLDRDGGGAGDRVVDIVPGRRLRFTGLNTALICSKYDVEGRLRLGERQRVLPRNAGEELIVLAHHPMKWMADGEDANGYVRARARVLITGHEHNPSARVSKVADDADLLTIEAGATVPPGNEEGYTYTYNFLEFNWVAESDSLVVRIHPRCWCDDKKEFVDDAERIPAADREFVLGSPRFRAAPSVDPGQANAAANASQPPSVRQQTLSTDTGPQEMPELYSEIVLEFFRDLSSSQRLQLLLELEAIPSAWNEELTHGVEKALLDRVIREGQVGVVKDLLEKMKLADGRGEDAE